jgi:hypothetical protein
MEEVPQPDPELNNKQTTLTELVVVPSSVDVSGEERRWRSSSG